jgi:hypothetical protein
LADLYSTISRSSASQRRSARSPPGSTPACCGLRPRRSPTVNATARRSGIGTTRSTRTDRRPASRRSRSGSQGLRSCCVSRTRMSNAAGRCSFAAAGPSCPQRTSGIDDPLAQRPIRLVPDPLKRPHANPPRCGRRIARAVGAKRASRPRLVDQDVDHGPRDERHFRPSSTSPARTVGRPAKGGRTSAVTHGGSASCSTNPSDSLDQSTATVPCGAGAVLHVLDRAVRASVDDRLLRDDRPLHRVARPRSEIHAFVLAEQLPRLLIPPTRQQSVEPCVLHATQDEEVDVRPAVARRMGTASLRDGDLGSRTRGAACLAATRHASIACLRRAGEAWCPTTRPLRRPSAASPLPRPA